MAGVSIMHFRPPTTRPTWAHSRASTPSTSLFVRDRLLDGARMTGPRRTAALGTMIPPGVGTLIGGLLGGMLGGSLGRAAGERVCG
jgi:hypothetical protein